jgi:hypothetical protein
MCSSAVRGGSIFVLGCEREPLGVIVEVNCDEYDRGKMELARISSDARCWHLERS